MYLIGFHPVERPTAAREFVLGFRDGRPFVESGRPGLLLEAVQVCEWDWPETAPGDLEGDELDEFLKDEAPSEWSFRERWKSDDPAWRWPKKPNVTFLDIRQKLQGRLPGGPWWAYTTHEMEPARSPWTSRPGETRSMIQNIVSVLLGRAGEFVTWPPLLQEVSSEAWKMLRADPPSLRYETIREMIEARAQSPSFRSPAPKPPGLESWTVVEYAHANYHPFPKTWLPDISSSFPPRYCFRATDWWSAALIEMAWAVEHDIWAKRCRYSACDVWFLQAGQQGKRREFCERHKRIGPPTRHRQKLRESRPDVFRLREQIRYLRAMRRRGSLSEKEFTAQLSALHHALQRLTGRLPREVIERVRRETAVPWARRRR